MLIVGVDLGIRKVALSVFKDGDLVCVCAYEATPGRRGSELSHCVEYALMVVEEALLGEEEDSYVFIEKPLIGNNRDYSMKISQHYGALLASLDSLSLSGVYEVNVSTWKSQVVGSGKANKESIKNYIRVTHPRYAALCGTDQDKFDATCVGLYGRAIASRARSFTAQ